MIFINLFDILFCMNRINFNTKNTDCWYTSYSLMNLKKYIQPKLLSSVLFCWLFKYSWYQYAWFDHTNHSSDITYHSNTFIFFFTQQYLSTHFPFCKHTFIFSDLILNIIISAKWEKKLFDLFTINLLSVHIRANQSFIIVKMVLKFYLKLYEMLS